MIYESRISLNLGPVLLLHEGFELKEEVAVQVELENVGVDLNE